MFDLETWETGKPVTSGQQPVVDVYVFTLAEAAHRT